MCKKIKIFTDGSCLGNPGPGGYCAILRYKNYEKIFNAGYILTTNNRMELMAPIIALESLKNNSKIIINTDSQYLKKGITQWIYKWKNNNWKTTNKKSVKNIDLWKKLDVFIYIHIIQWNWINSHNGHPENEFCDNLARKSAKFPTLKDFGYKYK